LNQAHSSDPDPDTATLYIDGHARVYHGSLTKLPRHYIARERLCLRATTDYWVNGLDGLPFFTITNFSTLSEAQRFVSS
jgi:hypothetical protein